MKSFDPYPELYTERFILRKIGALDDELMFELRSNPDVIRYIDRPAYLKIDEARKFIASIRIQIKEGDSLYWILTQKSDGKAIGSLCMWNFTSDRKTAEVGYDLLPSFHRKGAMSEAFPAVIKFGFEKMKLDQLHAQFNPENTASKALLAKSGFTFFKEADDGDHIFELKNR